MTTLVTGGAGFIGTNFVKHLVHELGQTCVVVDALTYAGRAENLCREIEAGQVELHQIDIATDAFLTLAGDLKPDLVFNFAAESHVTRSIDEPDVFVRTNVLGTQNVLATARDGSIGRLVHISTCEVYGPAAQDVPMTEEHPFHPASPYGASKAAADAYCQAYVQTYGIPVTIVRPFNQYGPYQHPEKLVPACIDRLLNGQSPIVHGSGRQTREWSHVADTVRAIWALGQLDRTVGEAYNIANPEELCVGGVIERIVAAMGLTDGQAPRVQQGDGRPGEVRRFVADIDKLCRTIDWEPVYDFERGIRSTIEWYRTSGFLGQVTRVRRQARV